MRNVLRTFKEVCEFSYHDYLKTLWKLSNLLKNDNKQIPKDFGKLCIDLPNRLKDFQLVESDTEFIRNAATHGDWEYDVKQQIAIMKSRKGEVKTFTTQEVFKKLVRLFHNSTFIIGEVISYYIIYEFEVNSGLMKKSFDLISEIDIFNVDQMNQLENEYHEFVKSLFQN